MDEAIQFAVQSESPHPKDAATIIPLSIAGEPFNDIIGPVKDRGSLNGIILRDSCIVAEWGRHAPRGHDVQPDQVPFVDRGGSPRRMAADRGLIRDVHDPVRLYAQDGGFDSEHNAKITWHQLLNQTSEWEGPLWGKPDWGDRWNGAMRELHQPGTRWRYNDVRVNRKALALLQVWRRPLPQVVKEHVMDPIGASPTWRWHGYENSWVTIDGVRMQSVSGGGHRGGGMWISTRDHARFAYLFLRGGKWKDKQLISKEWVERAFAPADLRPAYGYMNWPPNTYRKLYPSAPASHILAHGAGTNVIWPDPDHGVAAVVRWIQDDKIDEFVRRVLDALKQPR